jgi:hypothetical protein
MITDLISQSREVAKYFKYKSLPRITRIFANFNLKINQKVKRIL